jgi:transposase
MAPAAASVCQGGAIRLPKRAPSGMQVTTIGLDLAKSVFQVHGVYAAGRTVFRRRLRRGEMLAFFANLPPCLIGVEAREGAHWWAREIGAFGHEVRLMPARYVRPYVKRNKNDAAERRGDL